MYIYIYTKVLQAASMLIECLIQKGDFYDALRFLQFTLDSLKDPANGVNQESLQIAQGYYNLGNVINQQWNIPGEVVDIAEAEVFARESLRIYRLRADNLGIASSSGLLGSIFLSQNKLGRETKEMHELELASAIKSCGPEGENTAISYGHLGTYYNRLAQADELNNKRRIKNSLELSKSNFEEGLRIITKILGPNDSITRQMSENVMIVSHNLLMVLFEKCSIFNKK
jgi:tetratricopeptide (TPR) repeat protein